MDRPPPNSTLAIVSLCFGVLAWTLLPFIGNIVAIITGHMARSEIRQAHGNLQGDGLAIAGLILGYLGLLLGFLAVMMIIFGVGILAFLAA